MKGALLKAHTVKKTAEAQQQVENGNFEEALALYDEHLKANPKNKQLKSEREQAEKNSRQRRLLRLRSQVGNFSTRWR